MSSAPFELVEFGILISGISLPEMSQKKCDFRQLFNRQLVLNFCFVFKWENDHK